MQNKYCERSRISEKKFREIIKYFSLDLEAQKISVLTGVSEQTFYLHLKETEFRFNHRNDNLYQILLKIFRKIPLKFN